MDWWVPLVSSLAGVVLGASVATVRDYLKEKRADRIRAYQERVDLLRQVLGLLVMTRTDMVDLSASDQRFEDTSRRLLANVKWAMDLAAVMDAPQPVSVAIEVVYESLAWVETVSPGPERHKAVHRLFHEQDQVIQECRNALAAQKLAANGRKPDR